MTVPGSRPGESLEDSDRCKCNLLLMPVWGAGATNPAASEPGTIRGDYCIEVGRNIIHGSDAVESAQKEIALWFPEGAAQPVLAC